MAIIEIKSLKKKYGDNVALNDISFSLDKGEILGFLGVNGAGKTTTMNIVTGYILPTKGTVDIEKDAQIGYLPEQPPLYLDMTVSEYLKFVYNLKRVKGNREQHLEEIYRKTKLGDVSGRLIKNLSKGYRQRVGIAQALIGDPEILILDEPTVGLDPLQIIEIRDLIKSLAKTHTIIVSSHIMQEIEALATRVIIIHRGEIIADGTLSHLLKKNESLEDAFIRLVKDEGLLLEKRLEEEKTAPKQPRAKKEKKDKEEKEEDLPQDELDAKEEDENESDI